MRPATRPATPPVPPVVIKLRAGQRYQLWSERDTLVLVQSGLIQMRQPPVWVSETMLDLQTNLQEGQHYLLQCSGWSSMLAVGDGELWIYAPPQKMRIDRNILGRILITTASYLRRGARQLLTTR